MTKIVDGNGTYEGDVVNGRPHGSGKWIHRKGDVYEGEWKNGKYHGKGIQKRSDGSVYYDGEWKDGEFQHGKGIQKNADGSVMYEGEYKDGKRNGKGTFKWSDGRVMYDGEFKDGYPDGNGTRYYKNGDVYTGEYRAGKKHGMGVMTYANHQIYDGEWKNNLRHGTGSLTLTNGNVISGEWINDENRRLSILTSRKRAANNLQDVNESDGQHVAKRPRLEDLQSTIVQLQKNNEELQGQVVAKDKVIVEKDEVIKTKDEVIKTKDDELTSLKTMLKDEVVAKDEAIKQKDAELASLKAKLKKLGQILNESDGDGAYNQDDEQDGVQVSEAPKAKRPHVELDEEHTKCQICFTKFSTDTDNQDEHIRHLLPVSSESCDHYFCHGCITNQQVSIAEGRNGRVPKWIECMTCKAKTAFCPSKPRYHRLLIDFLTRAEWYAQPVEVKEED